MKNLQDVVQQTDVEDMFSKLQEVYLESLGIDLQILNGGHILYSIKDSQKLGNSAYSVGFELDLTEDVLPLITNYCEQLVSSASIQELSKLQSDIQKNRVRQRIFATDEVIANKTTIVNQYLDRLSQAARNRQKELEVQQYKSHIARINRILQAKNLESMFDKLQGFYRNEFGIELKVQYADDDLEDMQATWTVADQYQKLRDHDISLQQKQNLDTDDLFTILNSYFAPIVATLSFSELLQLGEQTKKLQDNLTNENQREFEIIRYVGPLYAEVKQQIQSKMDEIARQQMIATHDLALIVTHLDLWAAADGTDDIEDYLQTFPPEQRQVQADLPNATLRKMIKDERIKDYFESIHSKMWVIDPDGLMDTSVLKACMLLLSSNATVPRTISQPIIERLSDSIHDELYRLLINYKADVLSTVTDFRQSKKLLAIDSMLKVYENVELPADEKILQIKKIFDLDPAIHQTESIGRYLYRCLCMLLNKPTHLANFHMTLFQGLMTEDPKVSTAKSNTGYYRL